MKEASWDQHGKEYEILMEAFWKEIDKKYPDDDWGVSDEECKEMVDNYFKEHASKDFYEFYKNIKPIENKPGEIRN